MKLTEIKKMAKGMGLKVSRVKKADLIREIQVAEGNIPCFGTVIECDRLDCLWREDCLPKK